MGLSKNMHRYFQSDSQYRLRNRRELCIRFSQIHNGATTRAETFVFQRHCRVHATVIRVEGMRFEF